VSKARRRAIYARGKKFRRKSNISRSKEWRREHKNARFYNADRVRSARGKQGAERCGGRQRRWRVSVGWWRGGLIVAWYAGWAGRRTCITR
jgi:hypothetical protein